MNYPMRTLFLSTLVSAISIVNAHAQTPQRSLNNTAYPNGTISGTITTTVKPGKPGARGTDKTGVRLETQEIRFFDRCPEGAVQKTTADGSKSCVLAASNQTVQLDTIKKLESACATSDRNAMTISIVQDGCSPGRLSVNCFSDAYTEGDFRSTHSKVTK